MTNVSKPAFRVAAFTALLVCLSGVISAAEPSVGPGRAIASTAPDWPQWRGPRRDGVSSERGLLQEWPAGGPRLSWTASGLGQGFGSPIIVGDSIYLGGDVGEDLVVVALDLAGKERWRTPNGKKWVASVPGGRATCCYDNGRLYLLNAHGRLACLNAVDGAEVWAVNILEKFESNNITWGISESVLVDGKALFVTPIGKKALMAALDKETGATLWTTPAIPNETPTYSSAILVELNGRRQLINCGDKHVFGVDATSGALIWQQPHAIAAVIGMSPVYYEGSVYVGNTTKDLGKVYRLRLDGKEPSVAWTQDLTDTECGNVLCVDGMVLGSRKRNFMEWLCLSAETGEIWHTEPNMASGSAIYADNRFYCLTVSGTISLHQRVGQGLQTVGRMDVVTGKQDVWAHPVVCGGRLYVRYHDTLHCYDIRQQPAR